MKTLDTPNKKIVYDNVLGKTKNKKIMIILIYQRRLYYKKLKLK